MIPFNTNGLSLTYTIEGQGPCLILLHGFLEDASIWKPVTSAFKDKFRLITIDLPGHGTNKSIRETYSITDVAVGIHALLVSLRLEGEITVLGHSMGGYVGLELKKLVSLKLLLLHSNFWADDEQKKVDRNRVIEVVKQQKNKFIAEAIPNLFAEINRNTNKSAINTLIKNAQNMSVNAIVFATMAMRDRPNNHHTLDNTTILHGELDPIISTIKLNNELKHGMNQPIVFQIQNCGHMSLWEKPIELINLLENILIP